MLLTIPEDIYDYEETQVATTPRTLDPSNPLVIYQ